MHSSSQRLFSIISPKRQNYINKNTVSNGKLSWGDVLEVLHSSTENYRADKYTEECTYSTTHRAGIYPDGPLNRVGHERAS
jgi:hypothetical protein